MTPSLGSTDRSEKAVLDPAPFGAWPSDMRRLLGDTRGIQFTFFYN
jgi:hypothetical protein